MIRLEQVDQVADLPAVRDYRGRIVFVTVFVEPLRVIDVETLIELPTFLAVVDTFTLTVLLICLPPLV